MSKSKIWEFIQQHRLRLILISAIALILTTASYGLVHLPWINEEEKGLITKPSWLKKYLNRHVLPNYFYDTNYIRDHFLIVNTTRDQELTLEEERWPGDEPGVPITSRKKLYVLLRRLYEDTSLYHVVVMDVEFQRNSTNAAIDDSLQKYVTLLTGMKKIIFGMAYDDLSRQFNSSMIHVDMENIGATNRETIEDVYFRHTLSYSGASVVSLPFLLFARHHNTGLKKSWFPDLVKYKPSASRPADAFYNSFIPEIFFDRSDFDTYYNSPSKMDASVYDKGMAICDLGKIAADSFGVLLPSLLNTGREKKDIFVGAITGEHTDTYKTIYGSADGAIILLNTYYCLELAYNHFSLWEIMVTFIFFIYIAYRIVYVKPPDKEEKELGIKYFLNGLRERAYYLLLVILTMVSYFLFKHTTNVIVLIILIEIFNFFVKHFRRYRLVKVPENKMADQGALSSVGGV